MPSLYYSFSLAYPFIQYVYLLIQFAEIKRTTCGTLHKSPPRLLQVISSSFSSSSPPSSFLPPPLLLPSPSSSSPLTIHLYSLLIFLSDFLQVVSIESHAFSVYVDGKFLGANWDVTKACCDLINITVNISFQRKEGRGGKRRER